MERVASLKKKDAFAILGYLNRSGFTPTLSSQSLGWDNLFTLVLPYPGHFLPSLALPAFLEEDVILVNLSNPVQFSVKIGKEPYCVRGAPGSFSTAPHDLPTRWQILGGPTQILILSIKHAFLTRVALEALDVDPYAVKLAGKVGVEDPFIHQISLMILKEIESQGLAGRLFIDSLAHALVIHLLRTYVHFHQGFPVIKGKLSPKVLRAVLDFIEQSLEETLTLEKIAAVANLSPFHFSRLFKQTMNLPVHQYVLQKRLDCGKSLLTRGGLTVAEVAARAGFADTSHFHRHFKRRFGIAPGMLTK